jgi:hypothetical protein
VLSVRATRIEDTLLAVAKRRLRNQADAIFLLRKASSWSWIMM